MICPFSRHVLRFLLLAFGIVAYVSPTWAQEGRAKRGRVPVTITIDDRLPAGVDASIYRSSKGDVIGVRENGGDSNDLSDAIIKLLQLRQLLGDTSSVEGSFRIKQRSNGNSAKKIFPWAPQVLEDVKNAHRKQTDHNKKGGVVIWLPASKLNN